MKLTLSQAENGPNERINIITRRLTCNIIYIGLYIFMCQLTFQVFTACSDIHF